MNKAEKSVGQPVKPAGSLVPISFLLGATPVLVQIFGFQFLPSTGWAVTSFVPGVAGGLLGAVLFFRIISRGIDNVPGSELKKFFAVLASPLFGFILVRNTIVITGPMILALIAGYQTDLTYVVDNADHSGSRGCRSPLSLQKLPFLFDKLCRIENEFKLGLARGSKIIVTGHGTSFGVFPDSIRRLD